MDWVRAFGRSVVEEDTSSMMLKRLKQAWKSDRLGVLGVGSILAALMLWAFPMLHVLVPAEPKRGYVAQELWESLPVSKNLAGGNDALDIYLNWFPPERIPAVVALFATAITLWLFRGLGKPREAYERMKRSWRRDRLGVMGVGSALLAFALWAFPVEYYCTSLSPTGCVAGALVYIRDGQGSGDAFFTPERLPAIAAFVVLGAFLLLLRRR
jgi:hypothetical protein